MAGMWCCSGTGGNCDCSSPASCPQCNPNPPKSPYQTCTESSPGCQCVTIAGIPGSMCMPECNGLGSTCPPIGSALPTTATPYCDVCNNKARCVSLSSVDVNGSSAFHRNFLCTFADSLTHSWYYWTSGTQLRALSFALRRLANHRMPKLNVRRVQLVNHCLWIKILVTTDPTGSPT